jgi:hypothetical protein
MNKLRELIAKATPGPCYYIPVLATAANGASEDYAVWANAFPARVQVGKSTCIAARDMELIAWMRNQADAIAELIDAAEVVCRHNGSAQKVVEQAGLRAVLARLDSNENERADARQMLEAFVTRFGDLPEFESIAAIIEKFLEGK